jgi:hypothetical protein
MKEIDMEFPPFGESDLRRNEKAGHRVYQMMKSDIEKYNAKSMNELILSQII